MSESEIIVCSTNDQFRKHAAECLPADKVLEIGCSFGLATTVLAKTGATVLAVDVSLECVTRTETLVDGYPNVLVRKFDGRDVTGIANLMPAPDKVFLDVGGDALAGNVASVLRICLRGFGPRLVVVRSMELAWLFERTKLVQMPATERSRIRLAQRFGNSLEHLAELARSDRRGDREFAARMLRKLGTEEAGALLAGIDVKGRNQRVCS